MTTTEYTHSVTIAAPSTWIDAANSLAALMGQNPPGDMHTFKTPAYVDAAGVEYAVTHTVVRPAFLDPLDTGTLPPDPADPMPEGYSRTTAEDAFASINTAGGLLMAIDVDPHAQFAEWGLTPKPSTEEI